MPLRASRIALVANATSACARSRSAAWRMRPTASVSRRSARGGSSMVANAVSARRSVSRSRATCRKVASAPPSTTARCTVLEPMSSTARRIAAASQVDRSRAPGRPRRASRATPPALLPARSRPAPRPGNRQLTRRSTGRRHVTSRPPCAHRIAAESCPAIHRLFTVCFAVGTRRSNAVALVTCAPCNGVERQERALLTRLGHRSGLAALVLAVALFAAACGGDDDGGGSGSGGGQNLSGSVKVSGSSTVEPITRAVAEKFSEDNPNVQISVEGPGTGDGFKLFCNGETDVSDASRQINDEEVAACQSKGIQYIELQVGIDGISVLTSKQDPQPACLSDADLYALLGPESQGFK